MIIHYQINEEYNDYSTTTYKLLDTSNGTKKLLEIKIVVGNLILWT